METSKPEVLGLQNPTSTRSQPPPHQLVPKSKEGSGVDGKGEGGGEEVGDRAP